MIIYHGPEFHDLVLAISRIQNGSQVGLEIVSMRLYADNGAERRPPPKVLKAARLLLDTVQFTKTNHTVRQRLELGRIARASLAGRHGASIARRLCRKLVDASTNHQISGSEHHDPMRALLEVHPVNILDELFAVTQSHDRQASDSYIDFRDSAKIS